ncbi:MAG: 50S ribosomal protein L29 [Candidatus Omnitrophica bacterium CG11_big_fil_rev_8_21_14_0_20_45_26]|uniref:Large ribosomal subunit protein uL29 n=1 Tax=Candidatus Abzuiibacterium crystallinum TaxID=1974748 RepID=A0A2H0LNE3_9BACT|nr:MAG: 50S ribosomal protein L29 [Candidatus Omnitrophica bacterium CG11_big_fil_rev_8_21_14_0_20_45_26]PIW65101.1 MAG: 50S ribosomal protein L29 [Candidatus Omnitrophica bacterium CG12_big_fil_rev_8_21_14_0_65_45_16]
MPQTKYKELESLSLSELEEKYESLKKELFNLRLQLKLQKLTDTSRIWKTKKLIAKVSTARHKLEGQKQNG